MLSKLNGYLPTSLGICKLQMRSLVWEKDLVSGCAANFAMISSKGQFVAQRFDAGRGRVMKK